MAPVDPERRAELLRAAAVLHAIHRVLAGELDATYVPHYLLGRALRFPDLWRPCATARQLAGSLERAPSGALRLAVCVRVDETLYQRVGGLRVPWASTPRFFQVAEARGDARLAAALTWPEQVEVLRAAGDDDWPAMTQAVPPWARHAPRRPPTPSLPMVVECGRLIAHVFGLPAVFGVTNPVGVPSWLCAQAGLSYLHGNPQRWPFALDLFQPRGPEFDLAMAQAFGLLTLGEGVRLMPRNLLPSPQQKNWSC